MVKNFLHFLFQSDSKQDIEQQLRSKQNELEEQSRGLAQKDNQIRDLESGINKEKEQVQRLENEQSELMAKVIHFGIFGYLIIHKYLF